MNGMPHVDNDYYVVLQVDRSASSEDIRNAFRRMILRYHPDLNAGHPTAAESTILLYEAYETLSDPSRRADYDARPRCPDGAATEQPKSRSRVWKRVLVEPEPVVCQRCGHCDDTLRIAEFSIVTGLLWRTDHSDRNAGIYCSLCRFLLGTKWSLHCALFGWWSITGPYWTLRALPRNLLGAMAKPSEQKPVLLMLVRRLIWIQHLHDAERVLRRLIKIDPENPEIPGMLAEIGLLLGERSVRRGPILVARRLPPPAVSYLTIAIPVWLSIHYYPMFARSIAPPPPKLHPMKTTAGATTFPDMAAESTHSAFPWEVGDGLYASAPSQTGRPDSNDKDTLSNADSLLLDGDTAAGYRMRDYDWTNQTSSELLKPSERSLFGGTSAYPLSKSAPGNSQDDTTAIWSDVTSTDQTGTYRLWGDAPSSLPKEYGDTR